MNKVKKRIYKNIERLAHKVAIRFDKMASWAFWKEIEVKRKENTDRMISNAKENGPFENRVGVGSFHNDKYGPIALDSWAKDIREQEQESMEALARFSEMQMKMDGYEIIRQPVNGGLVGIRRPIEKEKNSNE